MNKKSIVKRAKISSRKSYSIVSDMIVIMGWPGMVVFKMVNSTVSSGRGEGVQGKLSPQMT